MLHEAALLCAAEDMLAEVLGRVRPQDELIVLPPLHVRATSARTVRSAIAQHLRDEDDLCAALTGAPPSVDITFAGCPFTFTFAGSSTEPGKGRPRREVEARLEEAVGLAAGRRAPRG